MTAFVDSVYFTELAPVDIPATCAGLEELFGYFGDDPPDVSCVNFKAGILVPGAGASALAASYTYTGLSGFEVAGAVSVVDGFSSPSLTLGPRPDGSDTPSDPTDPADPADPGSPADEGPPAGGDDAASPGELPRTGSTTTVLAAIGRALAALGTGAVRLRTRRSAV